VSKTSRGTLVFTIMTILAELQKKAVSWYLGYQTFLGENQEKIFIYALISWPYSPKTGIGHFVVKIPDIGQNLYFCNSAF